MFDHEAALRHVGLLFALLRRLIACAPWSNKRGAPPAPVRACLEKAEAALARTMRAGLRELGVAFPDCADHELLAWFVKTHANGAKPPLPARPQRIAALWTAAIPAGRFSVATFPPWPGAATPRQIRAPP